jgi:hypothetical protein
VISALALLLVWAALLVPDRVDDLAPSAFLRIPVEGLLFVVVVLVLPPRVARILALFGGLGLGALTILRLLDMGFHFAFDRPFHPLYDAAYAGSAVGLLGDSIGRAGALVVQIGAGLLIVGLIALLPLSAVRLTRLVATHQRPSIRMLATAIAMVTTLSGAQLGPAGPIASTASARLAYTHATQVCDDLRGQQEFVRALEQDPFRNTRDDDLLTGLRGKDVLLVFVESYGRTALDLPVIESALDAGERRLQKAGFSSRSGFLTSPTFGGLSWLAHITLQSGLWVDNQRRCDHLVTLDRLTLTDAFGRAGWRTVADTPASKEDWPVATTYYQLRPGLRPPERGTCRAAIQLRLDAGSVHPGRAPAPGAQAAEPGRRHGRDRPGLQPHPLGAAAPARRLEPGRRRLGLRPDAGRRRVAAGGEAGPLGTSRPEPATPSQIRPREKSRLTP